MFNLIKGFLTGLLAGSLSLLGFAYTHHVVRTCDGLKVVSKETSSFDKVYVEMRAWGPLDYVQQRDVVQALARADEQSRDTADQSLRNNRDAVERALQNAKRDMQNAPRRGALSDA